MDNQREAFETTVDALGQGFSMHLWKEEILAFSLASCGAGRALEMSRRNLIRQGFIFRIYLKPAFVFLMVLDNITDDMIGDMNSLNKLQLPANSALPYEFWEVCPLWKHLLNHHRCCKLHRFSS